MSTTERDRIPRAPSKKPCRFFHQNDCFRGDKCHMVHAPKDSLAPCETHRLWVEDPWARPACEWGEDCTFPHPRPAGPEDPALLRTNVALQTENSQIKRVREYASNVLGKGGAASDTGVARSGTSRYKQKLALLEARDPQEFSRRCVTDPSLCRSLLRVYLLGGGVCGTLEEAGKAISEAVAAGNYPGGGKRPAAAGGDGPACPANAAPGSDSAGAAAPPPPLRVRVQALPKVMELQLIDEQSSFWDDHFPNLVRERQAGAFTHVLSVIFSRGAFLWGLAEASTHGRSIIENNNEDTAVCRAFYKITEVYSRAELSFGEGWTAIDIGSAPGGWTSFLASKCRRVLSVDPAELDPAVLALPNVVHVRQVIQAATGILLDLLAEAPPPPPPPPTAQESSPPGIDGLPPGRAADRGEEGGHGSGSQSGTLGASNGTRSGSPPPRAVPWTASKSPAVAAVGGEEHVGAGIEEEEPRTSAAGEDNSAPPRQRGVDLLVSDMNAEPRVVADVLLTALAAGLARPGAVVVATFKDFCGRHKRMRDEVASAVARLRAGTAAPESPPLGNSGAAARSGGDGDGGGGAAVGVDRVGEAVATKAAVETPSSQDGGDAVSEAAGTEVVGEVGSRGIAGAEIRERVAGDVGMGATAASGAGRGWRLEGIESMRLLAGGQTEVTIVARVAYGGSAASAESGGGGVTAGSEAPQNATARFFPSYSKS